MNNHQLKLKELVDELVDATRDGDLDWQWIQSGRIASAKLRSGLVEIKEDYDSSGQNAIRITLFAADGDERLSFDDTDIGRDVQLGPSGNYFEVMKDLHESAERFAKGEDEILTAMIQELTDRKIPF